MLFLFCRWGNWSIKQFSKLLREPQLVFLLLPPLLSNLKKKKKKRGCLGNWCPLWNRCLPPCMSGRAEVSTGQDPKEEVVVMEMGQTRWEVGGACSWWSWLETRSPETACVTGSHSLYVHRPTPTQWFSDISLLEVFLGCRVPLDQSSVELSQDGSTLLVKSHRQPQGEVTSLSLDSPERWRDATLSTGFKHWLCGEFAAWEFENKESVTFCPPVTIECHK